MFAKEWFPMQVCLLIHDADRLFGSFVVIIIICMFAFVFPYNIYIHWVHSELTRNGEKWKENIRIKTTVLNCLLQNKRVEYILTATNHYIQQIIMYQSHESECVGMRKEKKYMIICQTGWIATTTKHTQISQIGKIKRNKRNNERKEMNKKKMNGTHGAIKMIWCLN